MRICVVGSGYVGLVSGTCLAEMGNTVVCHDIDRARVARLEGGELPLYEPGLDELIGRNRRDGRLRFSHDLAGALDGAEICFIAVGTPSREDGTADCAQVLAVAGAIGDAMRSRLLVVVKSTVPAGTCEQVRELIATR